MLNNLRNNNDKISGVNHKADPIVRSDMTQRDIRQLKMRGVLWEERGTLEGR